MIDLLNITHPEFLKKLTVAEMDELATQIRSFLLEQVSHTGGHLSSNLGIVELTIALHHVFDSPNDKLIFDVGHQAYVHKILTGRAKDFPTLRQYQGLSGYLRREESVHDCWEAGHSSTAIAALAGFELAKKMNGETHKVIAVVGDGSLNSGLSFEAINFLGHRDDISPIIILNDNEMSISKNVGSFAKLLNSMRASKTYVKAAKSTRIPRCLRDLKIRIANMLRGFAKNMTVFDAFGLKYYGPIDGHNIKTLVKYLHLVRQRNCPTVLHVITKKGKGYPLAENDHLGMWHGVDPFVLDTGLPRHHKPEDSLTWSQVVSQFVYEEAAKNPDFRVIIPAMINGSGLRKFQEDFPDQIIDVGICEAFAVCLSGAIAINHKSVFVPIYSSFLQRAYDQVIHDVARQKLHVVLGIDRAGLVGGDGETHQGLYDIAYLRHIPNIEIVQGKDVSETYALLDYAFHHTSLPIAIRYSRNRTHFNQDQIAQRETITQPSWTEEASGQSIIIIAYGENIPRMSALIERHSLDATLINARFLKPCDHDMLQRLHLMHLPIIVVEDSSRVGGLGSAVLETLSDLGNIDVPIKIFGLPDRFIEHGDATSVMKHHAVDDEHLLELIHALTLMPDKE